MKPSILANAQNPDALEALYRDQPSAFKSAFTEAYPELRGQPLADAWHARLNFPPPAQTLPADWFFVAALCFIAGLTAKLPDILSLEPDYFYQRNFAFIVLPALTAFFARRRGLTLRQLAVPGLLFVAGAVYLNALPSAPESDTLILASLHLPLFLWAVLGYAFTGASLRNDGSRIDFLRFNGDLVVMSTLLVIAGGLTSAITFGLFELIGMDIVETYMHWAAVWGLPSIPIVATWLIQRNPQLVRQVSPVIARVFTPLVLFILTVYLAAVIASGKDPYNDREFLLVFNVLLLGVMALIVFSVSELSKDAPSPGWIQLLLALAVVTAVVNGLALSAIVFRISEWGLTPNRLAVLGANLIMLAHLLTVTFRLFRTLRDDAGTQGVESAIGLFLPLYAGWALFVAAVVPALFGFR